MSDAGRYSVKRYFVQKAGPDGEPVGGIVAAKLACGILCLVAGWFRHPISYNQSVLYATPANPFGKASCIRAAIGVFVFA
jgi:hypothetical protein